MASRFDIATRNIREIPPEEKKKDSPSGVLSFGLDSDIGGRAPMPMRLPFFRLSVGERPRIAFVAPDSDHMFTGAQVHWAWSNDGRGRYALCKKALCCTLLGRPRWRIGTAIFRYNNNSREPPTWAVLPWVFGERIFNQLREINKSYPFGQHDLIVHCENDHWQTLNISPCSESIYHMAGEAMSALYSDEIKECQSQISRSLGVTFRTRN